LKNSFTFVPYKFRQDGDGYILVDRFTDPEFRPTYITEQNPRTEGRQLKVLAVFSLMYV
jgi:hypothetical protein